MPGIHKRFFPFFRTNLPDTDSCVLDVGAGHGAFAKELHELGYQVEACDLFPEIFHFEQIKCKKADLTLPLPYQDHQFDAVVAMEVMEHILDHEVFFKEVERVLKPGGKFFISTPNVLSLKSRFRFLFSGFFYSFKPLNLQNNDGLQHVASLTVDQYNYLAERNGLRLSKLKIDKKQSTSRWLMVLYPLLWLYTRKQKLKPIHNSLDLLMGRVLFFMYQPK